MSWRRWSSTWRSGRNTGFARSRAAWLVRGPAPGDAIRVRVGPRIETGRFAGLDPDGALLLDEAGALRRVIVGDVMAA